MEEKKMVCQTCGRELPVEKFKKTRWGSYASTCTECACKKMRETKQKQAEKLQEVTTNKLQDARNLRLKDFTSRELMEELARRGYEGKLTFTEVHTIDITNF